MADSNRRSMSLNNSQAGDVVVSSDPMSERLIADDTKDVESGSHVTSIRGCRNVTSHIRNGR